MRLKFIEFELKNKRVSGCSQEKSYEDETEDMKN